MKNKICTRLHWILLGALLVGAQLWVNAQGIESKIDDMIRGKFPENGPGSVFLVAKKGDVIYKRAFGLANLELQIPMETNNVLEIGSMTKQFTAVSILMLMEEGKLRLEDEIIEYIPDYPTRGHIITIHHLLNHTSGIKNFSNVKGLNTIANSNMEPLEMVNFFKNEPMDFSPGEKFKYNNSGYIVLGYIIEKVSGMDYAEFVEQRIFKKLGMSSSYYASHSKVIPNRAPGYHKREDYINARHINYSIPFASGSLMSTVDDMFKWQEAIKNHVLLSKETTDRAYFNYTLNNGERTDYGYGWHVKSVNGTKSYEHGGSIFGFKSMGIYLPQKDIYVIGLSNCDCNSPTKITQEIAEMVLNNNHLDN